MNFTLSLNVLINSKNKVVPNKKHASWIQGINDNQWYMNWVSKKILQNYDLCWLQVKLLSLYSVNWGKHIQRKLNYETINQIHQFARITGYVMLFHTDVSHENELFQNCNETLKEKIPPQVKQPLTPPSSYLTSTPTLCLWYLLPATTMKCPVGLVQQRWIDPIGQQW